MGNIILAISVVLTLALAIAGLVVGIGQHNLPLGTFLAAYALVTAWAGALLASKV